MSKIVKKSKKALYVAAAVLTVVILVVIFVKKDSVKNIFTDNTPSKLAPLSDTVSDSKVNVVNYGPSSPSDNDQINDQKKNADQTATPVYTGMNATITNTRVANSLAQVSVLISGATSGNCTVTLIKSGSTSVTKTVSIALRNSITTCEDFNIPVSNLSAGTWDVKVVLESNQTISNPAEGILQIGS